MTTTTKKKALDEVAFRERLTLPSDDMIKPITDLRSMVILIKGSSDSERTEFFSCLERFRHAHLMQDEAES